MNLQHRLSWMQLLALLANWPGHVCTVSLPVALGLYTLGNVRMNLQHYWLYLLLADVPSALWHFWTGLTSSHCRCVSRWRRVARWHGQALRSAVENSSMLVDPHCGDCRTNDVHSLSFPQGNRPSLSWPFIVLKTLHTGAIPCWRLWLWLALGSWQHGWPDNDAALQTKHISCGTAVEAVGSSG
jgi:hypothetical protein